MRMFVKVCPNATVGPAYTDAAATVVVVNSSRAPAYLQLAAGTTMNLLPSSHLVGCSCDPAVLLLGCELALDC